MPGSSAAAATGNPTASIAPITGGLAGNLTNQQPSSVANNTASKDATNSGKASSSKKKMPAPSDVLSPSIGNPDLGLAFDAVQNGSAKENSKGTKTKDLKNNKAAKSNKGVDESANSPNSSVDQKIVSTKKLLSPQAIADGGIGAAKVGITLAELKKTLKHSARFETQTDFIPGYNALAVKQQGKVQFYVPYPKNRKLVDTDQIKILVTDNPIYKTAEGVSPGMTIKKAAAIYGNAQLAFDAKAKIEEYVTFANQPQDLYFFTGSSDRNGRAGIYPKKSPQQGFVTDKFGDSGRIKRITVICPKSICTSDQP
jgi:hypothetical protein